jgi:hypothetical protein
MRNSSFGSQYIDFNFDVEIGIEVTELFGNTAKLAWDNACELESIYLPDPQGRAWEDTVPVDEDF